MASPGWLTRSRAELPAGDDWLGPREAEALAPMRFEKRRGDWRLGRLAAKAAVAAWLEVSPTAVEILAAPDGGPEAWLGGRRAPVALSLSHRGGRALAVVGEPHCVLGCDLELVEPRSQAFVDDWLTPAEGALVARAAAGRDRAANLLWTAKEAAAKVRRAGLRLDLRHAEAELSEIHAPRTGWRPFTVRWRDGGGSVSGWWSAEPGWVMAVAGEPAPGPPRQLG